MATADELLAATSEATEEILVADLINRVIVIPATLRILGVESDDDVRRLHFSVPRYYGDVDLSEFKIQVNFENAKGDGDVWPVDDLVVNQDDTLTFSWLVDRSAFMYAGNVIFNLCMKKYDTEGIVVKELNTTTASLPVLKGLETSKEVVENNPSAFDALLFRLYAVEDTIDKINGNGSSNVDLTGYVKSVNGVPPDENGNVQITIPDSGGNVDQSGLSSTAANLLIEILRNGVYSTDQSANIASLATELGVTESEEDSGDTHTHSYTSAVTTAATCTTAGVRTYTCSCGDSYTEEIPATGHNYVDGVCTVCGAADPTYDTDVTLSSISATYSGGDVTVGTAVTDLTGIVVTAHYSDGSTETVTGYTLSGEIAEGSNIITVSYGGKTTTFIVTGVAESGEVVTMSAPVGPTPTITWYSDEGNTAHTPLKTYYGAIASADSFGEDTTVKITFDYPDRIVDSFTIASANLGESGEIANCTAYYAVNQGTGTWTVGGQAVHREFEYTIKAGYHLLLAGYSIDAAGTATITVEVV